MGIPLTSASVSVWLLLSLCNLPLRFFTVQFIVCPYSSNPYPCRICNLMNYRYAIFLFSLFFYWLFFYEFDCLVLNSLIVPAYLSSFNKKMEISLKFRGFREAIYHGIRCRMLHPGLMGLLPRIFSNNFTVLVVKYRWVK